MRTLLTLLLLCWVSSTADGLKCYVCDFLTSNSGCNRNQVTCQAPFDACMTAIMAGGNSRVKIQQCSSNSLCQKITGNYSLANSVSISLNCCNTDLCNYSGAATSHLHTLLLALPLAAISALRYVTA